jgi:hypothetical protein
MARASQSGPGRQRENGEAECVWRSGVARKHVAQCGSRICENLHSVVFLGRAGDQEIRGPIFLNPRVAQVPAVSLRESTQSITSISYY